MVRITVTDPVFEYRSFVWVDLISPMWGDWRRLLKKNQNGRMTLKGAVRDFVYNLFTMSRTVSNTYAQGARARSCANRGQCMGRLSRAAQGSLSRQALITCSTREFITSGTYHVQHKGVITSLAYHVQHQGVFHVIRLSRAAHLALITYMLCATWYEGKAQLIYVTELKWHLF